MGIVTTVLFSWVIFSSAFVLVQEHGTPKNDVYGVVLGKSIGCSSDRDCLLSVSSTGKVTEGDNVKHTIQVKRDSGEKVASFVPKKTYDSYEVQKSYNFGKPEYNFITGFKQGTIATPPTSDPWIWLRIFNALLLLACFIPWGLVLITEIDL